MDDEMYTKNYFSTLPGPQFYTTQPDEVLEEAVTIIATEELEKRFWYAMQCANVVGEVHLSSVREKLTEVRTVKSV